MLSSNQSIEAKGSVYFESKWNLRITGSEISDRLFAGLQFSEEISGLREEVPAVRLEKEVLGLVFVLHGVSEGGQFWFTLEANPGSSVFQQLRDQSRSVDIGEWLARLIDAVPGFRVTGHSPC
jgi:hypothetical protein